MTKKRLKIWLMRNLMLMYGGMFSKSLPFVRASKYTCEEMTIEGNKCFIDGDEYKIRGYRRSGLSFVNDGRCKP